MNINVRVKDAVILAGGKGSRRQAMIGGYSKPMTPILGKRLIMFAIDSLLECGVNNIYIVYHSSTADVLTLSAYNDTYCKTLKFIEDFEQKGVLSAFYYAKDFVEAPLIMTFADIIGNYTAKSAPSPRIPATPPAVMRRPAIAPPPPAREDGEIGAFSAFSDLCT